MTGGDRIAIEIMRRWAKKGVDVLIFTGLSGYKMFKRYMPGSTPRKPRFVITNGVSFSRSTLITMILYEFLALVTGIMKATRTRVGPDSVIYSASHFWGDAIPGLFLKLLNPRCKWLATFWLFAPTPLVTNVYRGKGFVRGLLFYAQEKPVYWLVKKYADYVWVTNEEDKRKFVDGAKLSTKKVLVVKGGVDLPDYDVLQETQPKTYDAVFVGRFHPQKGVLQLIHIWHNVRKDKPDARLGIIGLGQLESEMRKLTHILHMESNVTFLGFRDGESKAAVFRSSRVILHPAVYDSGGMAAAEAMAYGLPGVCFDLQSLKSYYPIGMLKARCFDLQDFASKILMLLGDDKLYRELSHKARQLATTWSWDLVALRTLDSLRDA